MSQQFNPTRREDQGIGGIQNFGFERFSPTITNITGQYKAYGTFQRIGRLVYFAILLEGDGGAFTLTSSVLSPPTKPFKREVNGVADTTVFKGVCHQHGDAFTAIPQNATGTFNLVNETRTGVNTWITGHYWVE